MTFSKKETEILVVGLGLYKEKLKKVLKGSNEVKAGEKEIKQAFLETEKLIEKIALE